MNSQRGKASSNASRQNKSQKQRQPAKSQTNGKVNNNRNHANRGNSSNMGNSQPYRPGPQKMTSAASAYSSGQITGRPQIFMNSNESCRIIHRELICSVTGSANYTIPFTFPINPGLSSTNLWLATQAQGWEKYRYNSLRVCSYTRTGSNVPGSLALIPDYDSGDAAPVSEQIASGFQGVAEDVPWKDIKLTLSKKQLDTIRYVRTGNVPANQDVKTYDVAQVFISTVDGTAVNWSKVWLEYDVTLINQQLPPGGPVGTGTYTNNVGTSATVPLGTGTGTSAGSFNLTALNAGTLISWANLNIGSEYTITARIIGTVITVLSLGSGQGTTTVSTTQSYVNSAATNGAAYITFTATATSGSFTFTCAATTVTTITVNMSTMPLGSGF